MVFTTDQVNLLVHTLSISYNLKMVIVLRSLSSCELWVHRMIPFHKKLLLNILLLWLSILAMLMVMNVSHAMWCDQYFDWVYFSKLAMVMNVSHTMWHDQYFDWVYFSKLAMVMNVSHSMWHDQYIFQLGLFQ